MGRYAWFEGKPPCVGWWQASSSRDPRVWRWWDGEKWGAAVCDCEGADTAVQSLKYSAFSRTEILWTNYWPRRARAGATRGDQPKQGFTPIDAAKSEGTIDTTGELFPEGDLK